MATAQLKMVVEGAVIGGAYICFSAGLISFNKYMLQDSRFPHALQLTTFHMMVSTIYSICLASMVPSIYPTMSTAWEKKGTTLKYIAPLGLMFACALFTSNSAYRYCSVAFLQFCKEANVALTFFLACAIGMQAFSWKKLAVLFVVMFGCSLCAGGEINFVVVGFMLQVFSQVAECSKNVLGEFVMSGAGMKLDPLTFVAWQAPCSLAPLLLATVFTSSAQTFVDFKANLPLLAANATWAFMLNVLIALTLKRLSAVAFVIIGITKDIVIVLASAAIFGDPVSNQQKVGFMVTLVGVAFWANLKMQEQAENAAAKASDDEKQPLLAKECKKESA